MRLLLLILLAIPCIYCGHYPVPLNATIHRFYFEDTHFDEDLVLECNRDDRIQLWFNIPTKKSMVDDMQWYITNNTHKDIVYMEYQESKETEYRGMKGEEYESLDKKALMDSIERMYMHKEYREDMDFMRKHRQMEDDIPRKPRKLTLVQFHCYKVIDEEIQILMSQVPPRNFHEMRRQLRENKRNLAELGEEHQVKKFFTLYINVLEKQYAEEAQADL